MNISGAMRRLRGGGGRALSAVLLAVAALPAAHAAFTNGDFSQPVTTGWNPHGYKRPYFPSATYVPKQFSDLGLTCMDATCKSGNNPVGNTDILYTSTSATIQGAGTVTNAPALAYPDNVLRVNDDTSGVGNNTRASVVSQEITLGAADFDTSDNKFHIRFQGAPVLEYYSSHDGRNQAYFFMEVVKDDGTPTAQRIYTNYNFAGQPGVVFQSAGNYRYTAWTDFDIVVPNAQVGDKITLRVVAAGCGDTAHAGAFYMREARTGNNGAGSSPVPGLWIAIEDYPGAVTQYANPDGSTDIEYTYRYTNTGNTNLTGVVAQPDLPVTSDGTTTTFEGFTKQPDTFPNSGACTGTTSADMSCQIGDLTPGQTGTFKLKVRVPAGTSTTVNNGNYPISATGVPAQSGQLVQTELQANMVPDTSNLPAALPYNVPVPPTATYSCRNMGSTAAANAQCTAASLPTGVSVGSCTKTDINGANPAAWTQGSSVGVGETVTCGLTGTPTDPAQVGQPAAATVTGGADNSPSNVSAPVLPVLAPHVTIDLGGLPRGVVGQPYTGSFTCTSDGQVDAYGAQCGVTGLPPGLTVGQCTISPNGVNWNPGDVIPHTAPGNVVTCPVTGTPTQPSGPVTGTAGTDPAHSPNGTGSDTGTSATKGANEVAAVAAAAVPTLSEWGMVILAALMGLFMVGRGRRQAR